MRVPTSRHGYTLIELIVTILIIGVLTSIAVPQYLQTVEAGYADDAAATVNMIGTTNKMFALDHNGFYAAGIFPGTAGGSGTCTALCSGAAACPTSNVTATVPACALVCCKYLADQDWGDKKYAYSACDATLGGGAGAGAFGGQTTCGAGYVASARRGNTNSTTNYQGWGYSMATSGQILIRSGSTTPPASF